MISNNITNYVNEIADLAYTSYKNEMEHISGIKIECLDHIKKYLDDRINNLEGLVYIVDSTIQGYLLYIKSKEEDLKINCYVPVWGYGALGEKREKIINLLFQKLAENMMTESLKVHFQVNIYAHDEEIIRLFSFMEFGIQCETGVRHVDSVIPIPQVSIRELSKKELTNRWSEVWHLLDLLINHLRKTPIFYPGNEFTEEVYKDFFHDDNTKVFIAEKDGQVIGLIEANGEGNDFIFGELSCYNVGEAIVLEEYRGKGVAQALLNYVDKTLIDKGCYYQWVEHGTANPNARGFWNKYFKTYCYSMVRDIKSIN